MDHYIEKVCAQIGMIGETAVIEMAQAAGLPLVAVENRNPLVTTTYGVGEMIKNCIEAGCKNLLLELVDHQQMMPGLGC